MVGGQDASWATCLSWLRRGTIYTIPTVAVLQIPTVHLSLSWKSCDPLILLIWRAFPALHSSLDSVPMASHGTLLHFPLLLLILGPPQLATVCLEAPIVSPNTLWYAPWAGSLGKQLSSQIGRSLSHGPFSPLLLPLSTPPWSFLHCSSSLLYP